ncbi:MAG TPA: addiction module toxin RelE [Candidatus Nanoarchaeia archaeon]|nr:addiction module toxin RelE [Candidatus Nanoarchaeia archaeon]
MISEEWRFEYSERLTDILKKVKKKNPVQYEIIWKKINNIKEKTPLNPNHFKNLQHDLSDFKRVHIDIHFVLTFKVDKKNKVVRFEDYDHHDNIY